DRAEAAPLAMDVRGADDAAGQLHLGEIEVTVATAATDRAGPEIGSAVAFSARSRSRRVSVVGVAAQQLRAAAPGDQQPKRWTGTCFRKRRHRPRHARAR